MNARTKIAALPGRKVELWEPEPWDEEVDGRELLKKLVSVFKRYLVLPDGGPEAMALWTVYTHCFEVAQVSPRLAFTSEWPRCGKRTALEILSFLVPRPLPSYNAMPRAEFAVTHHCRPTWLMYEADWANRKPLETIVNTGHSRRSANRSANVVRCVGGDHEPRIFSIFVPVALANIGSLPPKAQDRSIVIAMHRKRPDQKVKGFGWSKKPGLETLARKAARWAPDNMAELKRANPERPEGLLNDRAADNWRLLFAIADLMGGKWPELSREVAVQLSDNEDDEPTVAVR